jgi:hypothetical protein
VSCFRVGNAIVCTSDGEEVQSPDCGGTHTPAPTGYSAYQEWCSKKSRTHRAVQCPTCGKWAIWEPKGATRRMP